MKISTRTTAQIITQIIIIIITIFKLSGCNPNPFDDGSTAFLTEKMNEIPIECEGYELIVYDPLIETVYHFEGEVEFNGSVMNIQYDYKIDGKTYSDYIVNYKNKTLYIDNNFMRERSETYVRIHRIWRTFKEGNKIYEGISRIMAVYPFDGKLFIVTDGIIDRIRGLRVVSCIPITLYVLDWDSEKIYYAGYYQDYLKPDVPVSIIKKGEAKDSYKSNVTKN